MSMSKLKNLRSLLRAQYSVCECKASGQACALLEAIAPSLARLPPGKGPMALCAPLPGAGQCFTSSRALRGNVALSARSRAIDEPGYGQPRLTDGNAIQIFLSRVGQVKSASQRPAPGGVGEASEVARWHVQAGNCTLSREIKTLQSDRREAAGHLERPLVNAIIVVCIIPTFDGVLIWIKAVISIQI